jgi:hypothetical protein
MRRIVAGLAISLGRSQTEDVLDAFVRFSRDIYAVGAAASEYGSRYDRAVLKLIRQRAAYGAAVAFTADDAGRDAAWSHVILMVDELLRHCGHFQSGLDVAERTRLQAFVDENTDALERTARARRRPEITAIAVLYLRWQTAVRCAVMRIRSIAIRAR